jgi:P27 family predicted phage terminase small subunit
MRGRKPIPTQLKILRGNPGKRPLNDNEPAPCRGIPPCPRHLNLEARKEWKRVSRELDAQGLLSVVDRAAFAGYCVAWSRWVDAEQKLNESGPVLKSPTSGQLYQNPYLAVANRAMVEIRSFAALFGLDPFSRTRLQVLHVPAHTKNDKSRFFRA